MDLEGIMLSEVIKSDREIQISYDLFYLWNLKNKQTNKQAQKKPKLTDTENRLVVA